MKIGILSSQTALHSNQRLVEAGQDRGHDIEIIDALQCFMDINMQKPEVHYKNRLLELDAVIPRIAPVETYFATAIVKQFETGGVYSLNRAMAIRRARDKLRAHQILSNHGIGTPRTGFANSLENSKDLINLVGGAPLVVKLLQGSQGKGVVLAETTSAAESLIEAFSELDTHFLVQEFIEEARGSDIRCFVIGNKVVAAMKRTAQEGDFRSNLHTGGTGEAVELTSEENAVALQAAKSIGLDVAGVDLLRSDRGPLVLEVNTSPGLQGIEKATGLDIASLMIQYVEKNIRDVGHDNVLPMRGGLWRKSAALLSSCNPWKRQAS